MIMNLIVFQLFVRCFQCYVCINSSLIIFPLPLSSFPKQAFEIFKFLLISLPFPLVLKRVGRNSFLHPNFFFFPRERNNHYHHQRHYHLFGIPVCLKTTNRAGWRREVGCWNRRRATFLPSSDPKSWSGVKSSET